MPLCQENFNPISYHWSLSISYENTRKPEEISEIIITFSKHLKSEFNEVVVSGIVPRGDSYKEKAEAVNMHFICHSNINVKQHLNRSNLHLNDHGISALVRNFKNFLKNFDSV